MSTFNGKVLVLFLVFFSGSALSSETFKLKCDHGYVRSFDDDPKEIDRSIYYKVYYFGGEPQGILKPPYPDDAGRIYEFDFDIGDWEEDYISVSVKPGSISVNKKSWAYGVKTIKISRRTGEFLYRKSSLSVKRKGKCVPIKNDPVPEKALF